MTAQYTMDINHSTLLTSTGNKTLVTAIKDTLLNDVGLANLNKQIADTEKVKEILNCLAGIIDADTRNRQYLFDARIGEHVFFINSGSAKLPAKIKDMMSCIPRDRTSIRYYMDDKLFVLRVNSRFYPLSGVTKITSAPSVLNRVFNGPLFIRRTNDDRFVADSREVWSLSVETIRSTINDLIEVIYQDIKKFWNRGIGTPPEALFIATTLLENLNTLMVLIRVNHNLPKFPARRYEESLVLEALEAGYNKYRAEKFGEEFTHVAIFAIGKLLERLVKSDYQHLLKGFLK